MLLSHVVFSIVSDLRSLICCREFASICDVIIVETSNVSIEVIEELEGLCSGVFPPSSVASILRDLSIQRNFFQANGFPIADSVEIDTVESAIRVGSELGYPFTIRYRLTDCAPIVVQSKEDIDNALSIAKNTFLLAEKYIPDGKNLIVTLIKYQTGEGQVYAVSESICGVYFSPAMISIGLETSVKKLATKAIDAISAFAKYGIFTVDIFVLEDGQLLLNRVQSR